MSLDLSDTLVVGISSTALFDLTTEDALFRETYANNPETAVITYREQMQKLEEEELSPGAGYPLITALLGLNKSSRKGKAPIVEVVVVSKNSPETGIRVLKNIQRLDLAISRSAFTGGNPATPYLSAFGVDLFLTTNTKDAQEAIDAEICAVGLLSAPPEEATIEVDEGEAGVRFAFDGDAVLFDDASEITYKKKGLEAFHREEQKAANIPLEKGPFANLIQKLSRIQERLPVRVEFSPIRIAIVTARNAPADLRVILTLRSWGVYANEAFFLGGIEKTNILKAYKPHIFFDDQEVHVESASKFVPTARVLYPSNSPLALLEEESSEIPDPEKKVS